MRKLLLGAALGIVVLGLAACEVSGRPSAAVVEVERMADLFEFDLM
jgi:hypothetical protein